jgi:hypothetical protein
MACRMKPVRNAKQGCGRTSVVRVFWVVFPRPRNLWTAMQYECVQADRIDRYWPAMHGRSMRAGNLGQGRLGLAVDGICI